MNFSLPSFDGMTRRLVLLAAAVFFILLVLRASPLYPTAVGLLALWPDAVLRHPWQLVTYPFVSTSLLGTLFALLSVWTFGRAIEEERGSRWLLEYFVVTSIAGGALGCVLTWTHVFGLRPDAGAAGMWPFTIALILAYARSRPEEEIRFNFVLGMKAKYMAALYLLFYFAMALMGGEVLNATVTLCGALAGFVFLQLAPRRGLGFVGSEWWYGLRNAYYRRKRRQAAKKFTVYMKKQGKDVSFDESGRYLDPNGVPRDPNDRRWMN